MTKTQYKDKTWAQMTYGERKFDVQKRWMERNNLSHVLGAFDAIHHKNLKTFKESAKEHKNLRDLSGVEFDSVVTYLNSYTEPDDFECSLHIHKVNAGVDEEWGVVMFNDIIYAQREICELELYLFCYDEGLFDKEQNK